MPASSTSLKPVIDRLGIRPGKSARIFSCPAGLEPLLVLPAGVSVADQLSDVVLAFVDSRAGLSSTAPGAFSALSPGGVLWFAFRKKPKGVVTDISRDSGWDVLWDAGWEGVSLIAIDNEWSAMRFRPVSEIPGGRRGGGR